jgi:hypothetical protein
MEETKTPEIKTEYEKRHLPAIIESHRYAVEVKTTVWVKKETLTETLNDFSDIVSDYKDIEDAFLKDTPEAVPQEISEPEPDIKEFLEEAAPGEPAKENPSLYLKLQEMTVSKKIEFAMKCNKEARTILVRDSNRLVQMAVIKSPKITDTEVVSIANNRAIHEDVLRFISTQREWMKLYELKSAMVFNPKAPLMISIKLVASLKERELSKLGKSKGVPKVLSVTAVRKLQEVKK